MVNEKRLLLKAKWFIRGVYENSRDPVLRETAACLVKEIESQELTQKDQDEQTR